MFREVIGAVLVFGRFYLGKVAGFNVVRQHFGDQGVVIFHAPLPESFAQREQNLAVSGVAGEVGHLAGVFAEIDQGFASLAVGVDAVFVAVGAYHAAFGRRNVTIHGESLGHVVLDDDDVAPDGDGLVVDEGAQAEASKFGGAGDLGEVKHRG